MAPSTVTKRCKPERNKLLPMLLPNYDMLILPSQYETFGIVLIEAMACGLPVIASNIAAMPEIVANDNVGYLINPEDIEEFKKTIKLVFNKIWDKQYIHKYAHTFSIEQTANTINKVYDSILNNESN